VSLRRRGAGPAAQGGAEWSGSGDLGSVAVGELIEALLGELGARRKREPVA
jgi:hypothetical protein